MIALRCSCGKKLQVPNAMAGRTGKCPGCGEPVPIPREGFVDEDGETVASDNTALELGDDPSPPKSRPPAPAPPPAARRKGAPAGPSISCPRCKAAYGAEAIFCPQCAVDLRTGKPVAGVVPGHMSAPRAVHSESRLWLIIRAFFNRPAVRFAIVAVIAAAAWYAWRRHNAPR